MRKLEAPDSSLREVRVPAVRRHANSAIQRPEGSFWTCADTLSLTCSSCRFHPIPLFWQASFLHMHSVVSSKLYCKHHGTLGSLQPSLNGVLPTKSTSQTTDRTSGNKILSTPLPNPSLQVTADHNLKQEDAPVYAPGDGEVLLHIKATGVCGYAFSYLLLNLLLKSIGLIFISGKQGE